MGAHLDIFNICVLSRKSRSVVKENRIMKLYFVNEMIGQLYDLVTLTMWKLSKKRHSPFWEKEHEVKDRPCFACSFIQFFLVFWYQSTLGKVISQAANSVNPDLPAFSLVQILHCGEFYTTEGQKRGSESPLRWHLQRCSFK